MARTDVRYWTKHVVKPVRGDGYRSPVYSVQIHYKGKRVRFPLETANREEAGGNGNSK